jgi:hypothetical protein
MEPHGQQGQLFQFLCAIWFARIRRASVVRYRKTECRKSAGVILGTVTILGTITLPPTDPKSATLGRDPTAQLHQQALTTKAALPGDLTRASFGPKMVSTNDGADVRPNWRERAG